jgi:hypothetical protein
VIEMEGDECKAYALLNSLFAMIVKWCKWLSLKIIVTRIIFIFIRLFESSFYLFKITKILLKINYHYKVGVFKFFSFLYTIKLKKLMACGSCLAL